MVMAGLFDTAIMKARLVGATATANALQAQQQKAAAAINATRATNPDAGSGGLSAIPKPVLIGGIAALALGAIIVLGRKKKKNPRRRRHGGAP